jgi:hypothetical protein
MYLRSWIAKNVSRYKDIDIMLPGVTHDIVIGSDELGRGMIENKTRFFQCLA